GEGGEIEFAATLFQRNAVHGLDELHLRVRETTFGGEGGAADHAAVFQFETANEFLRDKGIAGPALAALGQVEQLAVAAALAIDVEHAFNANEIVGRLFSGGRR